MPCACSYIHVNELGDLVQTFTVKRDIYGLGVLLNTIVSGRQFDRPNLPNLATAKLGSQRAAMQQLIRDCMNDDATQRPTADRVRVRAAPSPFFWPPSLRPFSLWDWGQGEETFLPLDLLYSAHVALPTTSLPRSFLQPWDHLAHVMFNNCYTYES